MIQTLEVTGYTCNLLLLLQISFAGVELPVRVENRGCSHGLTDRGSVHTRSTTFGAIVAMFTLLIEGTAFC